MINLTAGVELQMLNEVKLQEMAIAVWKRGGLDTLVKAMPFGTKPSADYEIGYCTTFKYIAGRTPEQMEPIIGLKSGSKLKNGAEIFAVVPLPNKGEFLLTGYTQCPEGKSTDDPSYVSHPMFPPGLGAPQWKLLVQQSHLVWLATVRPGEVFGYPVSKMPKP